MTIQNLATVTAIATATVTTLGKLSGTICTVSFIKKDGTPRRFNGKLCQSPESRKGTLLYTLKRNIGTKKKPVQKFVSFLPETVVRMAGKGQVFTYTAN